MGVVALLSPLLSTRGYSVRMLWPDLLASSSSYPKMEMMGVSMEVISNSADRCLMLAASHYIGLRLAWVNKFSSFNPMARSCGVSLCGDDQGRIGTLNPNSNATSAHSNARCQGDGAIGKPSKGSVGVLCDLWVVV